MSSSDAREAFRQRLRSTLDQAGWKAMGATALAREFNQRSHGTPVKVRAARKWLWGDAIAAQDKLQDLAQCSPWVFTACATIAPHVPSEIPSPRRRPPLA